MRLNIDLSFLIAYNTTEVIFMKQSDKKGIPADPDVFETAFAEFWEGRECDDLNHVIYDLIKAAFAAGYQAAGGEPPEYPRHVRLSWEVDPAAI